MSILLPKSVQADINVKNGFALKKRKPLAVVLRWDEDWEEGLTLINGKGSLILDFGKEMNGGIRIITGVVDGNSTQARIRFGESRSEIETEIGYKNATNDHSPRDFMATISGFSNVVLGETGFRYVRIDFLENKKVFIQNIFCINKMLSKHAKWIYNGADAKIGDIFKTAKRTVDLCVTDKYVVDGVKRDRLVWIGDMHPEMLALTTLYGRVAQIENSLDFMREVTPNGCWMNGVYSTYSMWWIIIVADYYWATNCIDFVKKQFTYINQLLKQFNDYVSDDGTLNYPTYFVDWQTSSSVDLCMGVRAINILAVNKAKKLLQEFGGETKEAEKLLEKLMKKPINPQEMKQVVALKYFALGEINDNEYQLLIKDGAKGMSTFMSYYILTAIASRDRTLAVEIMKEYYGGMLAKGATTFWEDFNIEWIENSCRIDELPKEGEKDIHGDFGDYCYKGFRHSLCHGWSSGVIKFIKENC